MRKTDARTGKVFGISVKMVRRPRLRVVLSIIIAVLSIVSTAIVIMIPKNNASPTNLLSIGLNAFSLFIIFVITVAFMADETPTDESLFYFYFLCSGAFLGAWGDAMSVALHGMQGIDIVIDIVTFFSYLGIPVMCISFYYYRDSFLSTNSLKRTRTRYYMAVLFWIDFLFIVSNFAFRHLYSIDHGFFIAGGAEKAVVIYPLMTVILSIIGTNNKIESTKAGKVIAFWGISLLPALFLTAWLFYSEIEFVYPVSILSVLTLYGLLHLNRSLEKEKQDKELLKKETQLLVSQINPHFIFNTISAVEYLCQTDPRLAVKTLNRFAKHLRINVNSLSQNLPVPFEDELEHTKNYLEIEHLRFPYISIIYDIQEKDFELPVLTVQPIVENAVRYGARVRKDGTVKISSYKTEGYYVVSIADNGNGFGVEKIGSADDKKIHVGIFNVRYRLEKQMNGTLEINSEEGKGTTVLIKVPVR